MPRFNWDPSYSVNVKQFDEDHQEMFRALSVLYDGMMTRRGQQVLQRALDDLLQCTEEHFASEEAVMRSAGYPQLQAQIEQHRRFLQSIKDVSAKYKADGMGMTIEIVDFLTDWLKKHIVGMDKQYSQLLNAKGIA